MRKITREYPWRLGVALLALCVIWLGATGLALAQSRADGEDPFSMEKVQGLTDPANGRGVMVAGELWDSFMPANKGPYYSEATQPIIRTFIRIGNFDRAWTTPTHMWPGGWTNGNYWAKWMLMLEYNPDPTFNPLTIGGVTNPAHDATSGPNYAHAAFKTTLLGANDVNRNYSKETYWVDAKRHHAIYEAGWPTSIGVDVKMKIHQWSLNWNNFNDFIVVEMQLTNTGNVDINCDGNPEKTSNVIRALTLMTGGEFMCSYNLGRNGGRGNRFGANRTQGYVGDNDPQGNPWDLTVGYPGESAAGVKDMGLNDFPQRFYTEVYSAWSWLGVKQGAGPSGADKQTLFGTHPTGTGAQRGWYTSAGQGRGLSAGSFTAAKLQHNISMGTWYKDGGKSRDATKLDLSPDPNFFASGTAGDPTTFVPKASPARPRGDRKLFSEEGGAAAFEVPTYEAGWTKGYTGPSNFDGDMFSGIGPFSLNVGETITVYWVESGGYRLQGVANAISAARWAFANGWNIPDDYPAVPEMSVANTTNKSLMLRWDNKAEATGSNFGGYKIWRTTLSKRIDWLASGFRGLDNYWKNTTVGATPSSLLYPINPNFAGQAFVAGRVGVPDTWGPYELVAVIPQAQLSQYADASVAGYNYKYEDLTVDLGFKYWYYISAYTAGKTYDLGSTYVAFPGTNTASTNTIETSHINVNGATGLWTDTYPWCDLNSFYPKTDAGLKAIGAGFTVKSVLANPADLNSGAVKISVKPNPYKKKALWDNATDAFDHRIAFYNLPSPSTITILDVSGQIIQKLDFTSTSTGFLEWNMFSKDGIEVSSGLYIYVVEYTGGQHVGYFSILR